MTAKSRMLPSIYALSGLFCAKEAPRIDCVKIEAGASRQSSALRLLRKLKLHTQRYSALTIAAIVCLVAAEPSAARAQDESLLCGAFYKNPDGSWTATQLPGTHQVSRVGGIFRSGLAVEGVDIAAALDKACPNPATTAAQTQQPRSSLSQFADANGTVDIARLTCAALADASQGETDLLLAWYNGTANRAPAKRRTFNLALLRTTIQYVVVYCRDHREQNLLAVIDELMPK
jgi:hypothetical protein